MGVDKTWAAVVCVVVIVLGALVGLGKIHWEGMAGFLAGVVIPMLTRKDQTDAK